MKKIIVKIKVDKSSSNKVLQDLVDTPQTVSVITNKSNSRTTSNNFTRSIKKYSWNYIKSWWNGNTNSKDNINMRGFDVQGSIFKDGIRDLTNTAKRYI